MGPRQSAAPLRVEAGVPKPGEVPGMYDKAIVRRAHVVVHVAERMQGPDAPRHGLDLGQGIINIIFGDMFADEDADGSIDVFAGDGGLGAKEGQGEGIHWK